MSINFTPRPALTLTGWHLIAAYGLAKLGARSKDSLHGLALNQVERELLVALETATTATREVVQRQQRQLDNAPLVESWITTKELARQRGCSVRSIQRAATRYGGQKINGEWRFPPTLRDTF